MRRRKSGNALRRTNSRYEWEAVRDGMNVVMGRECRENDSTSESEPKPIRQKSPATMSI